MSVGHETFFRIALFLAGGIGILALVASVLHQAAVDVQHGHLIQADFVKKRKQKLKRKIHYSLTDFNSSSASLP